MQISIEKKLEYKVNAAYQLIEKEDYNTFRLESSPKYIVEIISGFMQSSDSKFFKMLKVKTFDYQEFENSLVGNEWTYRFASMDLFNSDTRIIQHSDFFVDKFRNGEHQQTEKHYFTIENVLSVLKEFDSLESTSDESNSTLKENENLKAKIQELKVTVKELKNKLALVKKALR